MPPVLLLPALVCLCVCVFAPLSGLPLGAHVGRPWQNYDFTYKKTLKFNIKWHVIWAGRAQDTRQRDSDSDLTNGKPHVTCHMPHTTCHIPRACMRVHVCVCVCLSHRHHQICLNCIHRATFNFDWKLLPPAGGKARLGRVRVEARAGWGLAIITLEHYDCLTLWRRRCRCCSIDLLCRLAKTSSDRKLID